MNELVFWRLISRSYTLAELTALTRWADELERLTQLTSAADVRADKARAAQGATG